MDYILMHIPSSGFWYILHWAPRSDPDALCQCTCPACAGCTAGTNQGGWELYENYGDDRALAVGEVMRLNRQKTKA